MVENPLDYWPGGKPSGEPASFANRKVSAVVPVEFDSMIAQTTDTGAGQAIRLALENVGIEVYETSTGSSGVEAETEMKLFVHSLDAERAKGVAAEVISRREKFKAFPKVRIPNYNAPSSILMIPMNRSSKR